MRSVNGGIVLYAPSLTFVADASKVVEGVVKAAFTGKPLPGCWVNAKTGYNFGVSVITDAEGKYRVEGFPKNPRGYNIHVLPPPGSPFMSRMARADDTEGFKPVSLNVELVQGAIVTGRVVDKQTGKGVQAGVRLAPLPDNKFFGTQPGFDSYPRDRRVEKTEKDGTFRIVTIPGKAVVIAQENSSQKLEGEYLYPYRRCSGSGPSGANPG